MNMIDIDGSAGEGGGQILRMAVALSALTGLDCRVSNIRAGRPRPGLAAQHIAGIRGVAQLCSAELSGDQKGSTEIVFKPGKIRCGDLRLDVGTAGSITLVLQACLLPVIGSKQKSRISINGGTNVKWSPPVDYLKKLLVPMLSRMGARMDIDIVRRGFYPQGGGTVDVQVKGTEKLAPLDLGQRGELITVEGTCFSQNLPDHICKRISHTSKKMFLDRDLNIYFDRRDGPSTGTGICLFARYEKTVLGADCLGEKGLSSEKVGEQAARNLICEMEGPGTLDMYAADQLLPYMALAQGPSRFRVREASQHLRSVAALLPEFLDADILIRRKDEDFEVRVEPSCT
jgi:RNA 3'-phosphate cyclase